MASPQAIVQSIQVGCVVGLATLAQQAITEWLPSPSPLQGPYPYDCLKSPCNWSIRKAPSNCRYVSAGSVHFLPRHSVAPPFFALYHYRTCCLSDVGDSEA
ncbi:uncharacterized protein BYT42DRAFT_350767 [Radiomyces spectabilis]|uniref:uncharacterized protein n=1 Tax=Radiomyces spectabilis TaxID=64574 RepID=UPI002220FF97|nr:uncharacterized protein BYT42DRAFT_350767 [Radiomyces spectabilis]KAI8377623.1 hypothetical protein BYT42DRAFT_350767 [Radiomyces spectabilis]